MSTTPIAGARNTRSIRKVEAPRPLKSTLSDTKIKSPLSSMSLATYSIDSVDKLVILLDMVASAIAQNDDSRAATAEATSLLTSNIIHLCKHLKTYGPQLENSLYQGQLDRAFLIFRDAMVRGTLEYLARVHLLEVLELRERSWIPATLSPVKNYLGSSTGSSVPEPDFSDMKSLLNHYSSTTCETTANLAADEVLRRSGKHRDKPSRIPSKNYCKDEIVIRNSDSGKVTPTAKERLVQITGPDEEKIKYAEKLIEETIRNNSSPVRGLFESDSSYSSEDSSPDPLGGEDYDLAYENSALNRPKSLSNGNIQPYQYKHKVIVSNCQLTITGDDYTYVTVAKAVLDSYFSRLRKSELSSEDLAGGDVFVDKVSRSRQNSVKNSSKITSDSEKESQLPFSEPVDINSVTLLNHSSFTSESIPLPELSDMPSAVDTVESGDLSFDTVSADPLPVRSNSVCDADGEESRTIYTKELLMQFRESELSRGKPTNWDVISSKFPDLVKVKENVEFVEISD